MADTKTYQTGDPGPPVRHSAVLRILYGLERGKRFELVGTEFTIGRGDNADIVLADPTIAEVHAIILLLPGGARLRDAGSAAGLRVNGRIVDDEIGLNDGAQIEVGGVVLAFHHTPTVEKSAETAEEEAPDPPPLPPGPPRANPDEPAQSPNPAGSGSSPAPEDTTFTAAEGGGPSVRIDTGEKQVRQIGFRGAGIRRIRIGSQRPLITQLISWFVILTVSLTGMWVIRTIMYDSVRVPTIVSPAVALSSEESGKSVVARTSKTERAKKTGTEERSSAVDYGIALEAAFVETPDKARRTFDTAMRALWNDNNDDALAILRGLRQDHPDFSPPLGESVDQLIAQVETRSKFRDAVSRAATVTAGQTATGVEVRGALEGLADIPPTDPNFGPVAELYRLGLQRKLDGLGEEDPGLGSDDDADDDSDEDSDDDDDEFGDMDDDSDDDVEDAADDDDNADDDDDDEFGDMDDDLSDMALDEDGEVIEERLSGPLDGRTLMAQAKKEARRLYEEGRHRDAARIYGLLRREDGLTRGQREQCLYLERKLLLFGATFEEGINLVDDPETARQGIRRLESALAADRVLFRYYERLLCKQIADAHAVLALEALERADLVKAGEHMERGLARDNDHPSWDAVKPRVAALAMAHLERARGGLDADPVRAKRILKQVVAAAPLGSPAHEEASALLVALDRDDSTPTVPAEF